MVVALRRPLQLHTQNEQQQYCYCGQDRTRTEISLQCDHCKNWFHARCIQAQLGQVHPFITNYMFVCKWCNNGTETFARTTASWLAIAQTAIANLLVQHHPQIWFNKADYIIPYVDEHWNAICTGRDRTPTWGATLGSTMAASQLDVLTCKDERRTSVSAYSLKDPDVLNIVPAVFKTQASKRAGRADGDAGSGSTEDGQPATPENGSTGGGSASRHRSDRSSSRSRDHGSKATKETGETGTSQSSNKRRKTEAAVKATERAVGAVQFTGKRVTTAPVDNPFNRDGFRYTLAEQDPIIKTADEPLWREATPRPGLTFSMEDRSPLINLSRDGLHAWTEKGLRLARGTCGVRYGTWFWEATIEEPIAPVTSSQPGTSTSTAASAGTSNSADGPLLAERPHVRVGWARRAATLEAPIGYDEHGYGYRDKTGQKVHRSVPVDYGEPFTTGDVIGILIHLPHQTIPDLKHQPIPVDLPRAVTLPRARLTRVPIKFKGSVFFEDKDVIDNQALVLPGSYITFFKNGVSQGVAFHDIPFSDYYAGVSVYRGAQVFANFGQAPFKYPPTSTEFRPLDECFSDYIAEVTLVEMIDNICFGATAPNRSFAHES